MMRLQSTWILSLLAVAVILPACRGGKFHEPPVHLNPNMDNQDKYKPYRASTFFKDKRSMRTPPKGTMPVDQLAEKSLDYKIKSRGRNVASAAVFYTGKSNDLYTSTIPFKLDKSDLERGRDRYAVYCTPCHGIAGYGDGIVADRSRGKLLPTNFHEAPAECRPQEAVQASIDRLKQIAEAAMASTQGDGQPADTSTEEKPVSAELAGTTPSEEAPVEDTDPADAWKSEAYLGVDGYAQLLALEKVLNDPSSGCGEGSTCVSNQIELPSDATQMEGQCQRTLGYMYHVVTNGIRSMKGYRHQMTDPTDRWAVAAYVRALQLSQSSDKNQMVDALSARNLSPKDQRTVFQKLDKGGEHTFTNTQTLTPVKGDKK